MRGTKLNPRRRQERALVRSHVEMEDRLSQGKAWLMRHSSRTRLHRLDVLQERIDAAARKLAKLRERALCHGRWSKSAKAKEPEDAARS